MATVQPRVQGAVDFAHSAGAEQRENPIRAERDTRHERHERSERKGLSHLRPTPLEVQRRATVGRLRQHCASCAFQKPRSDCSN